MRLSTPTVLKGTAILATGLALYLSTACDDGVRPVNPEQFSTQPKPANSSLEDGGLVDPIRISLGKQGVLYVSDYRQKLVAELKVKRDGFKTERVFQVEGRPLGVAWAGDWLLVGNSTTHSVDVYDPKGAWLYALGGSGAVTDPKDIAVDIAAGLAFVVDGQEHTVKVFDLATGVLDRTISQYGSGEFDLQGPTGIAVDPAQQEILVSDYGHPLSSSTPPAVKIFGYDGSNIQRIPGKTGWFGSGKFSRPQGLAVNPRGDIFVVDAVAGVVVLDRASGNVLKELGAAGTGPNDLWMPLDVVIDDHLDVYVTNNRLRRVQLFAAGGQTQ